MADSESNDIELQSNSIRDVRINIKTLIKETIEDVKIKSRAHNVMFRVLKKRDQILSFPVVLFTAITSTSLILLWTEDEPNKGVILFSFILTSLSLIISSIQRFLRYNFKAHSHDTSSKLYSQVHSEINIVLIKNHLDNNVLRDLYGDVLKQISIIEEYEEPISEKLLATTEKKHSKHKKRGLELLI